MMDEDGELEAEVQKEFEVADDAENNNDDDSTKDKDVCQTVIITIRHVFK